MYMFLFILAGASGSITVLDIVFSDAPKQQSRDSNIALTVS